MTHFKPERLTPLCVTVPRDKQMWTTKTFKKCTKLLKSQTKLEFSVHTPAKWSCCLYTTPLAKWSSISFHLFDPDQLGDLEKDRDGLWFLSWDSDLSLLLYLERDLLWLTEKALHLGDVWEMEDSSSDNHLEGDDLKKEAVTISTSLFPIRQVHSYSAVT